MQRVKSFLVFSASALLLGSLSPWAARVMVRPAIAQEEPHKPPEEDPTHPADYLWQAAKVELIKDEPLQVTVPIGLQPLFPKLIVPASNPITKGSTSWAVSYTSTQGFRSTAR